MDSGVIVKEFKSRFGAIIANGQGTMKGKIFRIAHLGYFDFPDLFAVVAGLELILAANGYPVEFGKGVAAVQKVYAEVAAAAERAVEDAMNILIAEPMAAAGIELLRSQPGWNVVVSNPKEYPQLPGGGRCAAGAQRRQGHQGRSSKKRPSCASSGAPAWASTTSIWRPPPRPASWS